MLERLRERRQNKTITWDELSIWDKAALFNKWQLIMVFGNLFTIFGSIFHTLVVYFAYPQIEVFIGLGCCINWLYCVRYFATSPSYSIISRTMKMAMPKNMKFMFGVIPIFTGYVLLAMTLFWTNRPRFNSYSDTNYTFFSMMNGDSVLMTFGYSTSKNNLLG